MPRFVVIVPTDVERGPGTDDDPDGGVVHYSWHYNHRVYEYAGQAVNYGKQYRRVRPKDAVARVLIVDPNLLEEHGLSEEERFAFVERMATHYTDELQKMILAGVGGTPATIKPKRSRAPAKKPSPRRRRPAQAAPSPLAIAGVAGLGALIGNLLGDVLRNPSETAPTPPSPPTPPDATMAPFAPFSQFEPFKPFKPSDK